MMRKRGRGKRLVRLKIVKSEEVVGGWVPGAEVTAGERETVNK